MAEKWWNLDQAIAWVMTRDENIAANFEHGGIGAFTIYPAMPPYSYKGEFRGNRNDLMAALRRGDIIAYGFENGAGGHAVKMECDWWEDLEISNGPTSTPCIAVNVRRNGAFWNGVRIQKTELLHAFKRFPEHSNFSAPASSEEHERVYRQYNAEQVALYIASGTKKPWQAHDKEEPAISQRMGKGFDREKFRKARRDVLAEYPYSSKNNLSKNDHEELKTFILNQKQAD